MRFDEKPKGGKLHLKKSHAELSRATSSTQAKKTSKIPKPKKSLPTKSKKLDGHNNFDSLDNLDSFIPYKREKPQKLPEDYDEIESLSESVKSGLKNNLWVVAVVVALIVAAGFFTGTIQKIFHPSENESDTVAAATEEYVYTPKTVFTQGKFDLNIENTDAGVEIVCDVITEEDGTERKSCHAKTEAERQKEQEDKEREEQEKKAAEEREQEEKEDREREETKKTIVIVPASTEETKDTKTEDPARVTGITSIAGCPAEALNGSIVVLKASVVPYNAENQSLIWYTKSTAKVIFEGLGNTATVSVSGSEGDIVIVSAISVEGGYSEHCRFPIVSSLTE